MLLRDKVVVVVSIVAQDSAAPSRWPKRVRGRGGRGARRRAPLPGSTTWPRRSPRWGAAGSPSPPTWADPAAAEHLAQAALGAFGRVDALVYNALAMPPIKELGVVPLDAVSASFDANVVAALRLTRLFTLLPCRRARAPSS